jgi:hypothetical protein
MKRPYLIIIFLLTALSKSYGISSLIKLDTEKNAFASTKSNISLLQTISPRGATRLVFANAQLIRTGWSDGIFNNNFYRHDLASINPAGFEDLSASDREHFTISINQTAIKQAKDTVCYADGKLHRCIYTFMPVQLNNLSADTLKYVNMSCSWFDAFKADKECVRFLPTAMMMECWKNSSIVYMVPPHQQVVFNIPGYYLTDIGDNKLFASKTIKIGMSLFKYREGKQLPVDIYSLAHGAKTANVIWSNEVVIK